MLISSPFTIFLSVQNAALKAQLANLQAMQKAREDAAATAAASSSASFSSSEPVEHEHFVSPDKIQSRMTRIQYTPNKLILLS
jgi:hypothetical protein